VAGSPSEQEELEKSYEHLCKLRDEVIEMGIIPAIAVMVKEKHRNSNGKISLSSGVYYINDTG